MAIALAQRGGGSQFQEKERIMAGNYEVLTVKEVCEILRVHPTTVYKLTRQGKIPSFRIGTDWRFRADQIERWMAEKSMYARQVRKVIKSGVNGKV
jgi:excisionase family DNA binding protein